jgi:predicted DNA-binding protein with PD1-like motif
MEVARKGDSLALRLDHGDDILRSIGRSIEAERSTMSIVAGLGMISEFELGYFDEGNYIKAYFEEAHELLSMQGSVSSEGDPRIHIHVTVADRSHKAYGGHLLQGKAWMSNEVFMIRIDGLHSVREIDPETRVGILRLLQVESG